MYEIFNPNSILLLSYMI